MDGVISSFDNKLVVAWETNKVHVWDSVSLSEIATLTHNHKVFFFTLFFPNFSSWSNDYKKVVRVKINPQITNLICALEDNSIKVWSF